MNKISDFIYEVRDCDQPAQYRYIPIRSNTHYCFDHMAEKLIHKGIDSETVLPLWLFRGDKDEWERS